MSSLPVTLEDVQLAAARIGGAVVHTPCLRSETLSRIAKADIWIKFENLQFTASFKERGALNTLLQLTPDERKRGVIAMSAGNHAQGVAYHAGRLGIPATIVMPSFTPNTKVEHTRGHGARVVLDGDTLAEAATEAHRLAAAEKLVFVHPYDDPRIIAGQGTIALEMLQDVPELDTLAVPVGGGGMIAGCAVAARGLKPDMKVIGVESAGYSAMHQLLAGEPVMVGGDTIAEGIAVRDIGKTPLAIARALVDCVLTVDEVAIERAIALSREKYCSVWHSMRQDIDFTATWTFTDGQGNHSSENQAVLVHDTIPPVITCSAPIVVNAAGPGGVAVPFSVTATDNCSVTSLISVPASGSNFPIGTTTVNSKARDIALPTGNLSTCSFTVHVKSATEQLQDLLVAVTGMGPGKSLASKVQDALDAVRAGNIASACSTLNDFMNEVKAQSGKKLTVAQANSLLTDAARIRAVLGC